MSTPPGDTLRETLAALKITQTRLAKTMGRPIKTVSELINAKILLTPETALDLEAALGVPAHFWLALETNYRLDLARRARR